MHKHYKIVSLPRFIIFILVCIIIIVCVAVIFVKSAKITKEPSRIETYKNVRIVSGDTLWNISKNYSDNGTDVRKVVYDICRINNINSDEINPGDMIIVPEYI
ncbi:MAG: LysM peptidoglycan-binding domain-containing protein [Firmicutes bacterium]|nr:LysM peptidoglycan-binding domain-containing protein [Bacillota bacterium]